MDKNSIFSMKTPCFLPRYSNDCKVVYIENKDEWLKILFKMCAGRQIRIGSWYPYYKSDREDFEKFKEELNWNSNIVQGSFDKPDWYIFQFYKEEETYWSDKYEREETSYTEYLDITSLSYIKNKTEEFFKKFEND